MIVAADANRAYCIGNNFNHVKRKNEHVKSNKNTIIFIGSFMVAISIACGWLIVQLYYGTDSVGQPSKINSSRPVARSIPPDPPEAASMPPDSAAALARASNGPRRRTSRLADALLAGPDRLIELYSIGVKSDADGYAQLISYHLATACLATVTRTQHPTPSDNTSAEARRQSDEARAVLDKRCAPFYRISLHQLRHEIAMLRESIESETSLFSSGSGQINREENPGQEAVARKHLISVYDKFGTSALFWTAGALSDHIGSAVLPGNTPKDPTIIQAEQRRIHNAIQIAICIAAIPCGQSSLAYLSLCASTRACGDSIDGNILNQLNQEERSATIEFAGKITLSIQNRSYKSLGLE